MNDWVPTAIAIVVALIANGAGFFLIRSQRGKNEADAADILTGSALSMVKRWETRVLELEKRIDELEARVMDLECEKLLLVAENDEVLRGSRRLAGQVESLGHIPVWQPTADAVRAES